MTNAKGLPQGRIRQVAALVAPAEGMLFWQAVLLLSALQPSCCRSTSELYRKEVQDWSYDPTARRALAIAESRDALQQPVRPYHSSIAPLTRASQEYRIFNDVLMPSDNELQFFIPDNMSSTPQLPDINELLQWQYWNVEHMHPFKVTVVQASNKSAPADACLRWITQPTLWYSAVDVVHVNSAHFFHNMIAVIYTLLQTGSFSMSTFKGRDGLPSSNDANLMLLQRQTRLLSSPHAWLLDFLTPDVTVASRMAGSCFSTLIVGLDESGNIYAQPSEERKMRRRAAFAAFQEFTIEAVRRMHELRNWPSVDLIQRGQGNRTRIGWVSRPQKEWGSRAALNEEEVVHAIGQRYDADVRVLKFISGQGELAKAIVATHQLDILMGIHGAGLVNMLWMQSGAVIVQLLPYGWHAANTSVYPMAVMFEQTAHALGLEHLQWANTDPTRAFFKQTDFANRSQWVQHPDKTTPLPLDLWRDRKQDRWFMFQDTNIDITKLLPVVDQAVGMVGGVQQGRT